LSGVCKRNLRSVAANVSPLKLRHHAREIQFDPAHARFYGFYLALPLSATLALAPLGPIAILPSAALLTPNLTLQAGRLAVLTIATLPLDAIALPVPGLGIGTLLLTVLFILLVGAIGGEARLRRGEYDEG
jgi:hypothetical protein